jgi:hypothetical protein
MIKKAAICTFIMFFLLGCGRKKIIYKPASVILPNIEVYMKNPGFWIGTYKNADRIILDKKGIKELNTEIEEQLQSRINMRKIPPYFSKIQLYNNINATLKSVSGKKLYFEHGGNAGGGFYKQLRRNMMMNDLFYDGIFVYGLVFDFADQRLLPTKVKLFSSPQQKDIDELQNSGLDVGTPVAIMHETKDKEWYYVTSAYSEGWIESNKVILCDAGAMREYITKEPFVVVTAARTELFADAKLREYFGFARMGTRLPLYSKPEKGVAKVLIPFREKNELTFGIVYVRQEDIHEGYLDYTQANIVNQAFKMQNAPYGWGGLHGEQDCSRFVQQVFATVGIDMPRNSASQAKVGKLIASFDKKAKEKDKKEKLLKDAVPGITTLNMEGHIMLYLGAVDGRPYAIHEIWGYREDTVKKKSLYLIQRAVVSDLSLGKKSGKGSLLERITEIREMSK